MLIFSHNYLTFGGSNSPPDTSQSHLERNHLEILLLLSLVGPNSIAKSAFFLESECKNEEHHRLDVLEVLESPDTNLVSVLEGSGL